MRIYLFIYFCIISTHAFGQLTFAQVIDPADFSLTSVRQSETGEYFLRSFGDRHHVYRSEDLQQWTREVLPTRLYQKEIQNFSDGTPFMNTHYEDMVYRDGAWHTMFIAGYEKEIQNSTLQNDTIFALMDEHFFLV